MKDFVYHRYGGGFNMLNISDKASFVISIPAT